MGCLGTFRLVWLQRSVLCLALWAPNVWAGDFSAVLHAVLRQEQSSAGTSAQAPPANHTPELMDRVSVAYLQAMVAQDNFKALHAQIHAVVMQRNLIRRHFLNGEDFYAELSKSRGRIGTLLAQWIEAREHLQQQRKILSTLTAGAVNDVAGSAFAYIPSPLSASSPELALSQKGTRFDAATENEELGIELEVLRLFQAVQVGNAQLAAYKSALLWNLEALDSTSKAQDAANLPSLAMLDAMERVQQAQNNLSKARYDNLYQRIRLCAQGGMHPEAIAAHIDALLLGEAPTP